MAAEPIEKQEITSACTVDLTGIIVQLHEKALSEIKDSEYTVQNSAIDGEGKDAKFYGAGSHIIAAIPKENKGLDKNKIPKKKALEILQTYLQWFVGPDLKSNLKETDLLPLENEDSGAVEDTHKKKEDIQKSRKDTAAGEKYEESTEIKIPSFSEFLMLEAGEDDAGTDADASGDSATGDQEANSEAGDSDPESSGSNGEDESASGYYVAYQLDIKGQPSHPIADALKKMGADLLKGFGISVGSWRNGSSGEVHTIGDLANALADVFGKIDPKELEAKAQEKFRDDFKDSDVQVKVFDSATIVSHLSKQLAGSDKSKIKSAEMALTAKVSKKDKSYKLFNKQVVADTVTKSISGIFKKFKNKLTKNDVILVNNYSDNKKRKEDAKYTEKGEGAVEDSLVQQHNGQLLSEAVDLLPVKDRREAMKKKLDELAKAALKEAYLMSDVAPSKDVKKLLNKNGISEPKLFAELDKAAYSFVIKTKKVEEAKKESLSQDLSLLKALFEASESTDGDMKKKVQKVFQDLIYTFQKQYLPKGKDVSEKALNGLTGYSVEEQEKKQQESKKQAFELLSQVFEDMSFEDYDIIFEKDKKKLDDKKYQVFKKRLKANLEEIRKQKDKIIEKSYKDQGSSQMLTWTTDPEEAENNGYTDFISTIFSDKPIDEVIEQLNKVCHRQNFRNDIVYRFSDAIKDIQPSEPEKTEPEKEDPEPEPVPEEVTKVSIKFFDYDPANPDDDDPKVLQDEEIEKGGSVTPPAAPKHEGYDFIGWKPDDFDDIQEPRVYVSQYQGVKPTQFPVTFFDINFEEGQTEEIKTDWVEKGKAAKPPAEPDHEKEGFKFKSWSAPFDNVQEPMNIIAEYDEQHEITFVAPDPKAPEDESKEKPIGKPQKIFKPEELQFPEPPEIDGYEFEKWEPDEDSLKKEDGLNSVDKIRARYKKEGTEAGAVETTYWVIPDENGLLEGIKITFIETDPLKPDDRKLWKQIDGADLTDNIDKIKYPDSEKLTVPDGYSFGGWSIPEDKLKTDGPEKLAQDENNLIEDPKVNDGNPTLAIKALFVKAEFEIKIISPDPEDPDNTKSQEELAIVKVINGKYTADDLKAAAKDETSKDLSQKYAEAAKANEEAFKKVDNIKELEDKKKPYKFLGWTTDENDPDTPTYEKTTIQDTIAQVMAGPLPDEAITLRAVWSNDIKAARTELDFYIIPMKGLGDKKRFNNQTGRTEEPK